MSRSRSQFLFLCLLQHLRLVSSRHWTDCVDESRLLNDGMPRVAPRRNKARDYESTIGSAHSAASHMMAEAIEIEMHGATTTLFVEVDPFRVTGEPSSAPSSEPSSAPSEMPSGGPTGTPSLEPTVSYSPTPRPTRRPTRRPTASPTFSVATVPRDPDGGYFNYDPSGPYGPGRWKDVDKFREGDPGHFWHTFYLDEGDKVSNDCGSGRKQSPIDLCVKPKESCMETHEMRPKSGDYKMDSDFITKQILSNKLRLVMAPRTGEEPDPPQIDFSSNGRGIMDMTNIDFKFPSEHTICGKAFDGEMQYFTYHPARKRFVAVSFFLDASEGNPQNNHLQEVIEAFTLVYKQDEKKCRKRQGGSTQYSRTSSSANSFAGSFASGGGRKLNDNDGSIAEPLVGWDTLESQDELNVLGNETKVESDLQGSGLRAQHRRLALKWHPFHPAVQKTVHFWGYSGSLTDPPCTSDSVDWKIMDVPTPISPRQLRQLKHILFTHVDGECRRTSVHNAQGSVARPTQEKLKYYKCTRDDYVSDEERAICGDDGCRRPFGAGLNPYYPPLVRVTGPPTRSPSKK